MGARRGTGRHGRAPLRAGLLLGVLVGLGLPAQAARLLGVTGSEAQGYGRIAFTFDEPVSVKARVAGGVLVIAYGGRAAAGPERLAAEMPGYLTTVRRDPDGTGLRLALQRPVRVSVQEAGERVFVDLLPEGWSGAPPALPTEVVADLARRARLAEAALKARTPAPVRRPIGVEVATLPTLTRLSVRLPDGAQGTVATEGGAPRLRVAGAYAFDLSETRGRLPRDAARIAATADDASATLAVTASDGYAVAVDREDDTVVFDIAPRKDPAARAGPSAGAPAGGPGTGSPAVEPAAQAAASPAPPVAEPAQPARLPPPEAPDRPAGTGLVFPFARRPPAALFERGGIATLVFESAEPVAVPAPRPGAVPVLGDPVRSGPFTVLRLAVPAGGILDLVPVRAGDRSAWELTDGADPGPSEALAATRLPDAAGRVRVAVGLPQPGSSGWLDLDGERIAVVTSRSAKPAGLAKRQRFVDFELLPSRIGLAVLAGADDLVVRPDLDGVAIGRDGGLAVSAVARPAEPPLAEASDLAILREPWDQARLGDVREALRAQFAAAVAAPSAARGPLRMVLARTLLANGLASEALNALDVAGADDPLLAAARDTAILRGAALAGAGRNAEARRALGAQPLLRDPEAVLWRAVADGQAGLWREAEAGFLQALPVVERYPESLQAAIRTLASESAIETGDRDAASRRAASVVSADLTPLERDRLALVRARLDEAADRTKAALDAYDRLAASGERPVAAAAALRGTLLAEGAGILGAEDATERLERLAITWHGGETEQAINAGLARLYMAAGRYRDAFTAVRTANVRAPDAPATRQLHGEAQALFDDLFLSPRGDALGGIEAVALYFDFKDFAPIGRRGDAVVRRLAERLVGLDLLEPAADLLQHQIDHRLTGAARSSVATQLATIRLMDGKPSMALAAIEATDMPELPGDLRRARMLLRARALSDLSRTDLALEVIDGETGADAVRLRADILWTARRWREAGEAHEALLGDAWRGGKGADGKGADGKGADGKDGGGRGAGGRGLDDAVRADVIRAAIAYDLAAEPIGLERLKAKFAGAMAESADARTFALLTAADAVRNPGFRAIAQGAASAGTLSAFLAEYRKRYPDAAMPAGGAAETEAVEDGTGRRADGAAPPPG